MAGAEAVLRGTLGFGAHWPDSCGQDTTCGISEDLPMVVEIVDAPRSGSPRSLPELDQLMGEGLVTLEKVRVIKYCHREIKTSPNQPS